MNASTLAKEVVELLFPLLKMSSIQEIGNDLSEAADYSIRELWQKVSPLFIEEVKAEVDAGGDIQSAEIQDSLKSSVETKVRRKLAGDAALAKSLQDIIEEHRANNINNEYSISHSKNSVVGSSISAGGDVKIGDENNVTTTNIGQNFNNENNKGQIHIGDIIHIQQILEADDRVPGKNNSAPASISNIQNLVTQNRIKKAIEELLKITKHKDSRTHNQSIQLAGRWNRTRQSEMQGVLSNREAGIEKNRILAALLDMLSDLSEG